MNSLDKFIKEEMKDKEFRKLYKEEMEMYKPYWIDNRYKFIMFILAVTICAIVIKCVN
jgi:hypothetical protein